MKVLVLSDVHGNLPALQTVLGAAPITDAIWNLGDTVGYGANPNECLELLTSYGTDPFLVGNHDLAAVDLLPTTWFNHLAAEAARWTGAHLTDANRFRIRSAFTHAVADQFYLVHGSPADPASDYVQNLQDAVDALAAVPQRYMICGHTHIPMFAELVSGTAPMLHRIEPGVAYSIRSGHALLNPGSVGQPRDGDSRASAAILDTDALTITWHRYNYDIGAAQQAILAAGLPWKLAARLERGR